MSPRRIIFIAVALLVSGLTMWLGRSYLEAQRLAALENAAPEQLINFPNQLRGDQRDRLNADFLTSPSKSIQRCG